MTTITRFFKPVLTHYFADAFNHQWGETTPAYICNQCGMPFARLHSKRNGRAYCVDVWREAGTWQYKNNAFHNCDVSLTTETIERITELAQRVEQMRKDYEAARTQANYAVTAEAREHALEQAGHIAGEINEHRAMLNACYEPQTTEHDAAIEEENTANVRDITSDNAKGTNTRIPDGDPAKVAMNRAHPDCVRTQNGIYTIETPDDRWTFKLSTQPANARFAPGQRVLSVLTGPNNESDYRGIAFFRVGRDGLETTSLWRKYRGTKWERAADEFFCGVLTNGPTDPTVQDWQYGDNSTVLREGTCIRCNRRLTVPESIRSGIGPVCANL